LCVGLVGLLVCVFACADGDSASDDDNNDASPSDDDDDDNNDDDNNDNDTTPPNEFTVTVMPAPEGNPLAREVRVKSLYRCSLAGRVTTPGEPGYGPAAPTATPKGTSHSLWFYGLLAETAFDYEIWESDKPESVVVDGAFETPALPFWKPELIVLDDRGSDPDIWLVGAFNAFKVSFAHGLQLWRAVVTLDKQGRPRFFHETPPIAGQEKIAIQGIVVLANGDVTWSDQITISAVRPDGSDYLLFPMDIEPPYHWKGHHEIYINPDDTSRALIIWNRFGPGVECDLVTPTTRAVGDGISLLTTEGGEVWRWDVFDHQDKIPPERMNRSLCYSHYYGQNTFDWTHANAVIPFPGEDAVLFSLRSVYQIAKIDVPTGEILWQMGPDLYDFTWIGDDPPADHWFRMQHDLQWLPGDYLVTFDNGNCRYETNCREGPWSRALVMKVDEQARTVEPVWEHRVDFSSAMGNVQFLPNGNVLIFAGWRSYVYEVTPDHDEVYRARVKIIDKSLSLRYYPAFWKY
jgi:hypothetical protein